MNTDQRLRMKLTRVFPRSKNTQLSFHDIREQMLEEWRSHGGDTNMRNPRVKDLTIWITILSAYLYDEFTTTWFITSANSVSLKDRRTTMLMRLLNYTPSGMHRPIIGWYLRGATV